MSKYLLIVDDEEGIWTSIVRKIVMHYKDAYEPLIAVDGYEALDFMRTKDVAVAVLDLSMRNMGGLEACRIAKADAEIKDIPIIISSGFLGQYEREELERLGVEHFVDKPCTMQQLFEKIDKITGFSPEE